jgi:hypothetical protein
MKKYQYRKYKEVYQINIDIIKNFINKCGDMSNISINLKEKNKYQNGGNLNNNYFIAIYKD